MKKHAGNLVSWASVCIVISSSLTLNAHLVVAAVFIAAIMDMFDGKLARKYGDNTNEAKIFGELTDSLCDSFNFGIVPGILIPSLIFKDNNFLIFVVGCCFIIAGIYRLARFSATKKEDSITYYCGLPITVAGPLLGLSLIISSHLITFFIFGILLSYLMVSKIKVKKLKI